MLPRQPRVVDEAQFDVAGPPDRNRRAFQPKPLRLPVGRLNQQFASHGILSIVKRLSSRAGSPASALLSAIK
jgi:hypothetical protein